MWFALALLLFSLVYGLVRLTRRQLPPNNPDAPLPTDRQVLGLALLIGTCTFLVRIVQPMGTNILNMQLCFFSQYIFLFVVGLTAWRRNWLLRIPHSFGIRWLKLALGLGAPLWAILAYILLSTHTENKLGGGLTWQSAAFSLWESAFSVAVCLGLIVLFRERFNSMGKLARRLSESCFAVYLFHAPILIAVTLGMRGFEAPKLVKFLVASILGVVATYLASSLVFRRIPLLRRIL